MKKIITVITALLITSTVQAADVPLDIKKTIDLSLKTAEDLQIQKNQTSYTNEIYKEARAEILPQISADVNYTNNTTFPESAQMFDYQASAGASVNQLLWAFGRASSAIAAAKTAISADRYKESLTVNDLVYNAKYAYYTAVFAKANHKLALDSYNNLLKNKSILEERAMHGRVTKKDNIRMAADVAARKPYLNNAKSGLLNAKNTLKTLTETNNQDNIILTENFPTNYPEVDYNELKKLLLENEPSLKAAEEQINLQESLLKQYKARRLPSIYAFASHSYKADKNDTAVDMSDLEEHQMIGIKAEIPVWEGGRIRVKINQAEIDLNNAKLSYSQLKKNLLLELQNAVSDYNQYIETLKSNEDAVVSAKESFELSQESFASGQMSVIDLNDEEFKLSSQKLGKQETLFNINITLAKIEKLTTNQNGE